MGVYLYVVKQEGASSEQEHGLKSAALADLQKSALPVPKGFVISQAALDTFISENGLEEKIRSVSETTHKGMTGLEAIQKKIDMIFVKSFMPDAVKSEVLSAYGGLSLSEDVRRADVAALDLIKVGRNHERVAVRSSMVRSPDNSYAGVTSSFLNVTGEDELWRCIKLCWASAFHPHVLLYGERKGVEGLPKMSVIVQRMVDSEKSGSILTNFIRDKVLVEASWGLGSAVSSGIVSPDEYLLDRNGSLLEKNISKKLSMYVRNPMSGKTEKEPVPGSKMDAQVLTDSELRKLCELAEKVQGSKPDQLLIDWCIGRNRAFLLDVKQGNFDIERGDEDPGEALVTGRCASQGTGTGKVIMYPGENGNQFDATCIVVSESPSLPLLLAFPDIAGYVSNEGGRLCNFSILARELRVPALSSTQNASSILREGDIIKVLAGHGKVISVQEEVLPPPEAQLPFTQLAPDGPEDAFPLPVEPIQPAEPVQQVQPVQPSYPDQSEYPVEKSRLSGTKIFAKVHAGRASMDAGVDGYIVTLGPQEPGAAAFQADASGSVRALGAGQVWLQSKGDHDFAGAVDLAKRLDEGGSAGTGLLIPVTRGANDVERWRYHITGGVRMGMTIKTPAMAIAAGSCIKEGISMVSIELKSLVQLSMGLQRPGNDLHPVVLGMISRVFDRCREVGARTCVILEPDHLNNENIESLIRVGADCLCVEPALVNNLKDVVSRAEKKILLERGAGKNESGDMSGPEPLSEGLFQETQESDEFDQGTGQNGGEGGFSPSSFSLP